MGEGGQRREGMGAVYVCDFKRFERTLTWRSVVAVRDLRLMRQRRRPGDKAFRGCRTKTGAVVAVSYLPSLFFDHPTSRLIHFHGSLVAI